MDKKPIALASLLLTLFAISGTALVSITYEATRERIEEQKHHALLKTLNELIPPERYNNDIALDSIQVQSQNLLGTDAPQAIYRARMDDNNVAAVITAIAPDGYSGDITVLVGVNTDGTLAGVRVLAHKETPGLGDRVDVERSDWVLDFDGKSLTQPEASRWKVKKDGGEFDQFTGATVTPRAVVNAVYKALRFFKQNNQEIFASNPGDTMEMPEQDKETDNDL